MPFVPLPGAFRVAIEGFVSSVARPIANVIAVQYGGAGGATNTQFVADAIYDAWEARILPQLHAGYRLDRTVAYDLTSSDAPTATKSESPAPVGGRGASEALPISAAAVVTLRSLSRGRNARGRLYLSPLPETLSNAGVLDVSYITAIELGVAAFKADLNSVGITWGVLSQTLNGNPRPFGVFYPIVNANVRDPSVGNQRRRQGRS